MFGVGIMCSPLQSSVNQLDLLSKKEDKPFLKPMVTQIAKYVNDRGFFTRYFSRKAAGEAIFIYIDGCTKGQFSSAVEGSLNLPARFKYDEYKTLVEQFLGNVADSSVKEFDVRSELNKIVKVVAGPWGVIQSAHCANFCFL